MDYTLNIKGKLLNLAEPRVMGIINVTPDSFYAKSRVQTEWDIADRATQIVEGGGSIIDVGACSTRPFSIPVSEAEEMERLRMALGIIRREQPNEVLSVDTFRPNVARMAVEEFGADIINDVEGNAPMLHMVARLGVPYVLMSSAPTVETILKELASKVQQLRQLGQKDIIIDPGFGFGKTLKENYQLMNRLEQLQVLELPVLVGISRKSMIFRLLAQEPQDSLCGTTALHMVALMKGASILRVHDVKEAADCIKLAAALNNKY